MASMPQETAAGITALKPSSRKQRREFIKGVERVTTDPNDLIQSDNKEEEELVPRKMDAKQGWNHAYGNPPSLPLTIGSMHTGNPPSLPSTIKVMESSDSQLTSSVPGLSSLMDMSMTEISEENQISMIKTCMKKHVFSIWKFYQKDYHSHFSEDEKTLCGFIMKYTNIRGTENWWLGMRRIVVKTHTDLEQCNKNMQMKFKGEDLKWVYFAKSRAYSHPLAVNIKHLAFRGIHFPFRNIWTQPVQWMQG
ncbi:hypothetical protein MHU86_1647 [Fragilaria crotonensis]|nr:hypothetical protein MHU86_1647 [Fragilaria crotonensis]